MSITGTTVTHHQRWIEWEGADNTRDLGGLAAADGGRTRFGTLLRAGGVSRGEKYNRISVRLRSRGKSPRRGKTASFA